MNKTEESADKQQICKGCILPSDYSTSIGSTAKKSKHNTIKTELSQLQRKTIIIITKTALIYNLVVNASC